MACFPDQAEWQCYFTGEALADRHSHTAPPLRQYSLHSPCLDGIGTLFDSTSRKGSYDTSMDISEDEASASRHDTDVNTPRSSHPPWLRDGYRPHNSPPTPRLAPIQKLPWLPTSEYPEFQRQREAVRSRYKVFNPCRPALEDTPMGSPVDTSCTSIEPGSDDDDDGSAHHSHDHIQDVSSAGHTPSRRTFDSDDDREMSDQNGSIRQPVYSFDYGYLPEDVYNNNVNAPVETTWSMSEPRHVRNVAATRNGS